LTRYFWASFLLLFSVTSVASATWKEKVLYSFQGGTDGATPAGGVVFDKAGNLYGATLDGGSSSCLSFQQCGTVYQLAPPAKKGDAWAETVLYVFKGKASNDGASPSGGVVIDSAGNLYGTTAVGGTGSCSVLGTVMGCGTVYELSPPPQKGGVWTEAVLYSFKSGKDGYFPNGDLTFDATGNLYGATQFGGGKGTNCGDSLFQYCGTVFKLSRPKKKGGQWTDAILHSFAGGKDGANPNGGLVMDTKGVIYGTTYGGGDEKGSCGSGGCGTAFALSPPTKDGAWLEQQLHVFSGGEDGARPSAGLVSASNGNLYGTTVGTVFRLSPPNEYSRSWTESVLFIFGQQAFDPEAAVTMLSDGSLLGTTNAAQSYAGTTFRLRSSRSKNFWNFTLLYGFKGSPDGAQPAAPLVSNGGFYYSTTQKGGAGSCSFGCGTVFVTSK
jgi:hypothetical protein